MGASTSVVATGQFFLCDSLDLFGHFNRFPHRGLGRLRPRCAVCEQSGAIECVGGERLSLPQQVESVTNGRRCGSYRYAVIASNWIWTRARYQSCGLSLCASSALPQWVHPPTSLRTVKRPIGRSTYTSTSVSRFCACLSTRRLPKFLAPRNQSFHTDRMGSSESRLSEHANPSPLPVLSNLRPHV